MSALGYAHIAMHEIFDLESGALAEQAEFGERHLAADHDARYAILLQFGYGEFVMRVHHDRSMQRYLYAELAYELEDSKILHEDGIGLDLVEIKQIGTQLGQFFFADQVVQRDVEADTVLMGIGYRFFQHLVVEIEFALMHAHVEMLATEIDRVSSGFYSSFQRIPRAGRSQQLDGFTI